ncbi:MAG: C1 family peptidase [Bacteroidales bacterium]|nr:C1 family peptidase [Bacteroidales bacterium]
MRQKKMFKLVSNLVLLLLIGINALNAQVHPDFTITKSIPTTSVKNQYRTGTCWSFATISFLETEALRLGKPAFDLSEMYIVKKAYTDKAKKYVRYHGKANFSEGGQAHDVLNVIKKHGLLTEEIYPGLNYGSTTHNHSELVNLLTGMLNGLISDTRSGPSPSWLPAFEGSVESYLGKAPSEIKYQNKNYDPIKFSKEVVGINPDDYVELTSFKNYPYNKMINLEIPDNWSHDLYYNVSENDLMQVIDYALNNGYSVAWDGDVSEEDFNHTAGTAVLSLKESDDIIINGIDNMRQKTFDNYSTTDDHLMHLTGLAKDNNGSIFYLTKNSWGENSNKYGGYLYMSQWYVQLKTVAIMVHKDALPKDIKKKIGL